MHHQDHDYMHAHGIEHSHDHEHEHQHEHAHTHDGHVHSHPHSHSHAHEHAHPHDHEHIHGHDHPHDHDHGHCHEGCGHNCSGCASADPKAELVALMRYMVGHNTAHANELAQLAGKLRDMGENVAFEQVMLAVADFEKGNMRLSTVLAALNV